MPLAWKVHNERGILWNQSPSTWRAGHVNDVLELPSSLILAASASGGGWLLDRSFGLPLSMDWDAPDINVLVQGPQGSYHVFAGGSNAARSGGALYTTDPTSLAPLRSWLRVRLPPGVGMIGRMIVDEGRIVLATSSGLWHATIPPSVADPFTFELADGTLGFVWFEDVVIAADHSIVAATRGADDGSGRLGFFVGNWDASAGLLMNHVALPFPTPGFQHTVLAVSPSDPRVVYAACCDDEGTDDTHAFRGVLRSQDGGRTWQRRTTYLAGTETVVEEHSQNGYSGAIAVSPSDSNTLVFGYTHGPYISHDGGNVFTVQGAVTHDDKHSYRFTPRGRLYEASDGGVSYTDDLGTTFHSEFNQYLSNLQFLGPFCRDWWGRTSASAKVKELVGGGLQDNNDVYSFRTISGSLTPWLTLHTDGEFDGQAMFFPNSGGAIFTYGDVREADWVGHPERLVPSTASPIPFIVGSPIIPVNFPKPGMEPGGGIGGLMALVAIPQWHNSAGRLMIGVLAAGSDIYGLFESYDGSFKRFDYLGSLPLAQGDSVSSLASLSGRSILAGVRGRSEIWKIDPSNVNAAVRSSGIVPFPTGRPDVFVVDIVILHDDDRRFAAFAAVSFAAANGDWNTGGGQIYSSSDGVAWTQVPWTPGSPICCFMGDRVRSSLFAATDDQVYESDDGGSTWVSQSLGLPHRPHCSDLACVNHSDGSATLYLSTFGWSTWETTLPAPTPVPSQMPNTSILPVLVVGLSDAGHVLVPIHSPNPGPELGLAIYRLAASIPDKVSRLAIQQEALKNSQSELAELVKSTHMLAVNLGSGKQ